VSDILTCHKDGRPHTYRFPWANFTGLLQKRAETDADRPALIFRDLDSEERTSLPYGELNRRTADIAATLHNLHGIQPGDCVSLALPNCLEIPLITLALFRLGATSVPLDLKRDTPDRKRFKTEDSGSTLVCTLPALVEEERKALPDIPIVSTEDVETEGASSADLEPVWSGEPDHEQHTNVVLYTSGTTGTPKGACLTRQSLTSNADGIIQWLGFGDSDRLSLVLPLHHVNSTVFSLTMLMTGGTLILNSRYSLHQFWPVITEEKVTATSIVPTIMHDLNAHDNAPANGDLQHLRKVMIGSAPVPSSAACRFVERFGIPLIQGYGTTEVSLRVTGIPPDLDNSIYRHLLQENSIGRELANCNLAIDGNPEEGKLGEILVRGPVVAGGYLNQEEATREAFAAEWFHTGDIGCWREIDGERYYFIHGRAKEIIIKGGVNISPIAVENALAESVPEIAAAYVIGVPSERWGEEICSVVVFDKAVSADRYTELALAIVARAAAGGIPGLSPFEAPASIRPMDEESLPKTSTGKVQRSRLKDILLPDEGSR
jgi:long-chain acyl-CoA synthetase